MSSREAILAAVRSRHVPAPDLPGLDGPWLRYADPVAQFAMTLEGVGGVAIAANSADDVNRRLDELRAYRDARSLVSCVAGVGRSTLAIESIDDPHQLATVDFAVLPGEFAVAENAAVWVDDRSVTHRVVYFIVQHLALVVPRSQVVHNMHEAYARLHFRERGFGMFLSGPSKTADIEQSLVIGAHGPRSLTVFLAGE